MTTITKAEFDALPESLKSKFKADGDSYALIEEDVEGLKKSKAEILAEKKALAQELDDLKKFKSEYEASKNADEEEQLKKAGEFAQLEEKLRAKISTLETERQEERQALLNNFKTERLKNELTQRGVLADRAKYALADIAEQVELVSGESGFELKVKNGIGDAKEFDALIDGMKQASPFFFAASGASGSGASGSQGGGAGMPKSATKEQLKAMSPEQKREFYLAGGEQAK